MPYGGERRSFGGGRGGGYGGGRSSGGGFGRSFGPREMHKITCSACGKEGEVPFKPREGAPVYCRECFMKQSGKTPFKREGAEEKAEEKAEKAEEAEEAEEEAE